MRLTQTLTEGAADGRLGGGGGGKGRGLTIWDWKARWLAWGRQINEGRKRVKNVVNCGYFD